MLFMKNGMTSKERIFATIERKPVDHIPICFEGICHGRTMFLNSIYPELYQRELYYLDLGVDTGFRIQAEWGINPETEIREWTEKHGNEVWLIKEYITAKGNLRQVIRKSTVNTWKEVVDKMRRDC